jgi:hypothetical protein
MKIVPKFLEVLPIGSTSAGGGGGGGETSAHFGKANRKCYYCQKKLKDNLGQDKWLPDQACKQLYPKLKPVTYR